MIRSDYNQSAAFTEYVKGTKLEDISVALSIPLERLRGWSQQLGWRRLAGELRQGVAAVPVGEEGLARIKANREKNLVIAQKLQEDLQQTVDKLIRGELVCQKVTGRGLVVEHEPGLKERVDLALYAKNVMEMSYRALGDIPAAKGDVEGLGNVTNNQSITIVLPGPVAAPRAERAAVDVDSDVVELAKPAFLAPAEETPDDSQVDGLSNISSS